MRVFSRQSRTIVLVELAVVVIVAVAAAVAVWWPDGDPRPAARTNAPQSIDLPGLPDSTAPVLMPGRPGEPAESRRANEMTPAPRASYNNADIRFVTMMIPHHEQALVMARLVGERSGNPQLKIIADRILAAQEPEIRTLETWLTDRGLDRTSGGNHQHAMRGCSRRRRWTASPPRAAPTSTGCS